MLIELNRLCKITLNMPEDEIARRYLRANKKIGVKNGTDS